MVYYRTFENIVRIFASQSLIPAAFILRKALTERGMESAFSNEAADLVLHEDAELGHDEYRIEATEAMLVFYASGIRGAIYAIGHFLRKLVPCPGGAALVCDICGRFAPKMPIRGHQTGYRPAANSYDAWTADDFRTYNLEMMFFGANTAEHIPFVPRGGLMKEESDALLQKVSADAEALDLDLSLWQPQSKDASAEETAKQCTSFYQQLTRLDAVFIPGADPGDLEPNELIARCKEISGILKRTHPDAKLWVSAQQPHDQPDWGETFLRALPPVNSGIDGVIMGPNHAFPLPELRRRLPAAYPIRFYPDLTHNVRCEYPVHYRADDWHFALAAGLGRECTNPRPLEYAALFAEAAPETVGFVSYSDGINDDVNKAVWSALGYGETQNVQEILADYARLYCYGADARQLADAIQMLERNWFGDPAENAGIEETAALFEQLANTYPFLLERWRFVQLQFRAICDLYLRRRRIFELDLIDQAREALLHDNLKQARAILCTPFEETLRALRETIDRLANWLYQLIGMQLSVAKYGAENPERGAVLDTIDLPTTDRAYLRQKLASVSDCREALCAFDRNKTDVDEYYYSVSQHGVAGAGVPQQGEFYLNFRGDSPKENNGTLPTCLLTIYDHFSFHLLAEGLTADCDYRLTVTYRDKTDPAVNAHEVLVNGTVIYCGPQFGGRREPSLDVPGFLAVSYPLPRALLRSGKAEIILREPRMGVMLAELRIRKE